LTNWNNPLEKILTAPKFHDRQEAGQALAKELSANKDRSDLVVLGLPRGGAPVAFEMAIALQAPLDVFVVRKLGLPGHEEFAIGAIASGGVRIVNQEVRRNSPDFQNILEFVTRKEEAELRRQELEYRDSAYNRCHAKSPPGSAAPPQGGTPPRGGRPQAASTLHDTRLYEVAGSPRASRSARPAPASLQHLSAGAPWPQSGIVGLRKDTSRQSQRFFCCLRSITLSRISLGKLAEAGE
jgi:hypothetical protein